MREFCLEAQVLYEIISGVTSEPAFRVVWYNSVHMHIIHVIMLSYHDKTVSVVQKLTIIMDWS